MKRRSLFSAALAALAAPALAKTPSQAKISTFPSKGIDSTPLRDESVRVYAESPMVWAMYRPRITGHTHSLSDPGHNHVVSDPGHSHGTWTYVPPGAVPGQIAAFVRRQEVPLDWVICDGRDGTPDMRGVFRSTRGA